MQIQKVTFHNFKPYYGSKSIDLSVNPEQNIVLVGGRNGQGKTSFLVGLVWCIYGSNIISVDKTFSKEVKNNYPKFKELSLNRKAKANNEFQFSVSVHFKDIAFSEISASTDQKTSEITLTRTCDTKTMSESFDILMDGKPLELVESDEGKRLFIDDYLIPLEAAKFIFFDAEKIAEIAELSIKEQGRVMNDALSKILGLSKYEEAIEQLDAYIRTLKTRKHDRSQNRLKLDSYENKILIDTTNLKKAEQEKDDLDEKIDNLRKKIAEIDTYLARIGAKSVSIDIDKLTIEKQELENRLVVVGNNLKDIAEIIPFAISTGKIQELVEHLRIEKDENARREGAIQLKEKAELFVENLFEEKPLPDPDIRAAQKIFYMKKTLEGLKKILGAEEPEIPLPFYHELSKSSVEHVENVYNKIQVDEALYKAVFNDHIFIKNRKNEIDALVNKAKAKAEDETVYEYKEKRSSANQDLEQSNRLFGQLQLKIAQLKIDIEKNERQKEDLLKNLKVPKEEQTIIDEVNKHSAALRDFIEAQKNTKCRSLEQTILKQMNKIMHKLLIDDVKVNILPDKGGLDVTLYKNYQEVSKEVLSSGEKQIYISCLLKAILNESVTHYPILIDTPLARFDSIHKDNFVLDYYPDLAEQVIILSTDEEITVQRKNKIKEKVANTYLLMYDDNEESSNILNTYFE
jgi:DNA sulfur modification protein DndD